MSQVFTAVSEIAINDTKLLVLLDSLYCGHYSIYLLSLQDEEFINKDKKVRKPNFHTFN